MTIENPQLFRGSTDRQTADESVRIPTSPPATAELIPRVSLLRYRANDVNSSAASLGRDIYSLNLQERSAEEEKKAARVLVRQLSTSGVGWTTLARLLGVTTPAIRKWRQGEGASPANRHALARLSALVTLLNEQFMIDDPASWLEIPLAGTRLSLVDLYAKGRVDLILEYAGGWIRSPERILDSFDSNWQRTQSSREFETFEAADGEVAIRRRGQSGRTRPTDQGG